LKTNFENVTDCGSYDREHRLHILMEQLNSTFHPRLWVMHDQTSTSVSYRINKSDWVYSCSKKVPIFQIPWIKDFPRSLSENVKLLTMNLRYEQHRSSSEAFDSFGKHECFNDFSVQ